MSTKKSQGPLLYVYQPFSRAPLNSNMQEIYISKKKQKQLLEENQQENETKQKIPLVEKEVGQELIPIEVKNKDTIEMTAVSNHEKLNAPFKRVKPFKDMELNERLNYLIHFPKVLPPTPCVFYTDENNYQGYLSAYDEKQVTVQFHDQTLITFPVDELKDVMMIGLKSTKSSKES